MTGCVTVMVPLVEVRRLPVINLEVAMRHPLGTLQGGSFMVIWNAEKEVWNRELNLTIIMLS